MALTITGWTQRCRLHDGTVTCTSSDNRIEKISAKDMHIPKPDGTFLMTCDGLGEKSALDSL